MNNVKTETIAKIKEVLSEELDPIELDKVSEFINNETESQEFKDFYNNLDSTNKNKQTYQISLCMLLGLGRNRTLSAIEGTNRKLYEKIRDDLDLKDNPVRISNEKIITGHKFKTKTRERRYADIAQIDWNSLKEEYINKETISNLCRKYKLKQNTIIEQLKEENIFDPLRSSRMQSKLANEQINQIEDKFIIDLVNNGVLDSMDSLWQQAKETYPWLLRRQFLSKVEELGLKRTEEEINEIKSIKSKTMSNTSYQVKVNGYKAVEEIFGSVEALTFKYVNGELGSYNKIKDMINEFISFDYKITSRQVEKIITSNSNYTSTKSSGQQQLIHFIKRTFPNCEVIEEYSLDKNRTIDIYVPELELGIEYNGDYWHSNAMVEYNYGKSAYDFHADRVKVAQASGINLVYVWENDWINNYEEVETSLWNKNFKAAILNKYESELERRFKESRKRDALLKHIETFLIEEEIEYNYNKEENRIEMNELFMELNTNTRFN